MKYSIISIVTMNIATLFVFHKRIKNIEDSIDKMKISHTVLGCKVDNMEIIRDEIESIICESSSESNGEYEIV